MWQKDLENLWLKTVATQGNPKSNGCKVHKGAEAKQKQKEGKQREQNKNRNTPQAKVNKETGKQGTGKINLKMMQVQQKQK